MAFLGVWFAYGRYHSIPFFIGLGISCHETGWSRGWIGHIHGFGIFHLYGIRYYWGTECSLEALIISTYYF